MKERKLHLIAPAGIGTEGLSRHQKEVRMPGEYQGKMDSEALCRFPILTKGVPGEPLENGQLLTGNISVRI